MKSTIYALVLMALLAPAHPALCQQASEGDLGALMAGTGAPLSVKLSDLNASWRRLSASAPLESTDPSSIYARLLSDYVAAADVYYTQGHT
ncbi:MAG: hypothetical protein M3Y28_05715, partial [Armatimonadota bacterium]|nr:hypothetical protein [Armatimonadota bacterium]